LSDLPEPHQEEIKAIIDAAHRTRVGAYHIPESKKA
jgi:hypothetical protein